MDEVKIFKTFKVEFPYIINQITPEKNIIIEISTHGNIIKVKDGERLISEYDLLKPFIKASSLKEFNLVLQQVLDQLLKDVQSATKTLWPELNGTVARLRVLVEDNRIHIYLQSSRERRLLGEVTWVPFP